MSKTKTRGPERERGRKENEERREGESGDSPGGSGAVEPEGWCKSEREIRR